MSKLTPLQKKIKDMLETFTREEPFITNTAIRISILMPGELINIRENYLADMLKNERKRGYANGYAAGKAALKAKEERGND